MTSTPPVPPRRLSPVASNRVRWALRFIAAAAVIFVLAYHVDWRALPGQIDRISWSHALVAFLAMSAQFLLGPWKWQIALRMHGLRRRWPYLVRAFGIAFLFNSFLPSGIGGDAFRVASTWPSDGHSSRAISAVLVDRGAGFAALLMIGCVAALPLVFENHFARVFVLVTIGVIGGGALVLAGLLLGRMRRLDERLERNRFAAPVIANLKYLRHGGRRWLGLLALSVLVQACSVASIYVLFEGIGVPAPLSTCALIAAAAGIAVIVPLSISGIGVVEAAFVGAAIALGEPYGASLAVAVLMRLLVVPQALGFGLLYALSGHGPVGGNKEGGHSSNRLRHGRGVPSGSDFSG
jgi:uncharacterized protein (TIRG00374 family)